MSEQKDYQALGQYVDAKERVSSLQTERHSLAGSISRLLSKAMISSGDAIPTFDHAAVVEKAEELAQLNIALEQAIAEVKKFSAPAGKQPIRRT